MRNATFALLIVAIAAGAFAFRIPRLQQRPMHTDEAVHAVKFGEFLEDGTYVYDPHEYHGPTIYYFAFPLVRLTGAKTFAEMKNEVPMRLVPVIFGTAIVLLLILTADGLGKWASIWAGIFAAVSHPMVFYSRYFIQETLLIFFTFAAIACAWRYTRSKKIAWALLAGFSVGMMQSTKETCVIAYGAMIASVVLTVLWSRCIDGEKPDWRGKINARHIVAGVLVAALVSIVCMTTFFTNMRGALDTVLTYAHYFQRATTGDSSTNGAGLHNHPWYYYLKMLAWTKDAPGPWWSESLILFLAAIGMLGALIKKKKAQDDSNVSFLRFAVFYTVLMTIAYSLIPYKTPWCMLGFLHGMVLLAGLGVVYLCRLVRHRVAVAVVVALVALGTLQLAAQTCRGNFVFYADNRNPYVYGHTSGGFLDLVGTLQEVAAVSPLGKTMPVDVIVPGSDYWPLPWYLRDFSMVAYRQALEECDSGDPEASGGLCFSDPSVVITSPELEEEIEQLLGDGYIKEYYGLRFDVLLVNFVREDLFDAFVDLR